MRSFTTASSHIDSVTALCLEGGKYFVNSNVATFTACIVRVILKMKG